MIPGAVSSVPALLVRELTQRLLNPVYTEWFRTKVHGAHNIPATGPALVVANHAGAFAIDGLITMLAVAKNTERTLRVLGADFLFHMGVNAFLEELGVRPATQSVARELLEAGELVGVWPEGVRGVAKTFDQRYQLQRFGRAGFAAVAAELGVNVIPTAIIGSEEAYPLVGRISGVSPWVGIPYLPVTPTFPALGPLGLIPLPARWSVSFGAPMTPPSDSSIISAFEFTDQVQETMRNMIHSGLANRQNVF